MTKISESRFVVAYDGPALADHEMDVADLARSLLALSSAFKQAQKTLAPDTPPVNLHARATSAGSFEVELALLQPGGVVDGIFDLLTGRHATSAVNASGLVAIVWSAVGAIRRLAGRGIVKAQQHSEGAVTITTDDGDTIELDPKVLAVVASVDFRQHLSDALTPLDGEEVETIEIRDPDTRVPQLSIDRTERRYFDAPSLPESQELSSATREAVLQVVGVEFDWRKWRFTEGGGGSFHGAISDLAFRQQIDRQEISLGASDLLRVELRTRQYRDRQGTLRSEYTIERVLEHIDGGRQLAFEYEFDDPNDETA